MMTRNDRRKEWIGLGILLTEIRFRVRLERREDSKFGYRLKKLVGWRSLFTTGNMAQHDCVQHYLDNFQIELKENYYDDASIRLITESYLEGLTDEKGLTMMRWVLDNPPPSNFDEFEEWCRAFEEEEEMLNVTFST